MRVGGGDQSIGSTVSEAIVRSWLWSTATRSSNITFVNELDGGRAAFIILQQI